MKTNKNDNIFIVKKPIYDQFKKKKKVIRLNRQILSENISEYLETKPTNKFSYLMIKYFRTKLREILIRLISPFIDSRQC